MRRREVVTGLSWISSQVMGCPFSASDSFRLMLSPAHPGPGSTSRDSSGFWYLTSPWPASLLRTKRLLLLMNCSLRFPPSRLFALCTSEDAYVCLREMTIDYLYMQNIISRKCPVAIFCCLNSGFLLLALLSLLMPLGSKPHLLMFCCFEPWCSENCVLPAS